MRVGADCDGRTVGRVSMEGRGGPRTGSCTDAGGGGDMRGSVGGTEAHRDGVVTAASDTPPDTP